MTERMIHALLGAFLGSLLAVSALWYYDDQINWIFVSLCGGVCAALGFVGGAPFLDWLKELWWWT